MKKWKTLPLAGAKARIRAIAILAAFLPLTSSRLARAAPAVYLPAEGNEPGVMVYAAEGDTHTPRPVTVMLHGMCGLPEHECPHFASAVTRDSWLICPRATVRCDNGGVTWSRERRSETVEAAVERVAREYPGRVDTRAERTLIGFSLGAFVALDLAHRDVGRWQRLILIGAKLDPSAARLRENGVLRVLLGSGDFDLSRAHMISATRTLTHQGTVATFMSLGGVGHRFARNMDDWLRVALGWVHASPG